MYIQKRLTKDVGRRYTFKVNKIQLKWRVHDVFMLRALIKKPTSNRACLLFPRSGAAAVLDVSFFKSCCPHDENNLNRPSIQPFDHTIYSYIQGIYEVARKNQNRWHVNILWGGFKSFVSQKHAQQNLKACGEKIATNLTNIGCQGHNQHDDRYRNIIHTTTTTLPLPQKCV